MNWTKDRAQAERFMKIAELLEIEGPVALLGVESMDDYRGTFAEAVQILNASAGAIQLQAQMFDLAKELPEAVATANASFQTPGGSVWQVTLRPTLPVDLSVVAMKNMVSTIEMWEQAVVKGRGWTPVQRYSQVTAGKGSGSSGPSVGNAGESADLYTRKGVGQLMTVTVKGGKIEYDVDGRQYAIGDTRGAETAIAAYWHPDCFKVGFSKKSLDTTGIYEEPQFGQKLFLRFGKNTDTGYWDALAIYPEGTKDNA